MISADISFSFKSKILTWKMIVNITDWFTVYDKSCLGGKGF